MCTNSCLHASRMASPEDSQGLTQTGVEQLLARGNSLGLRTLQDIRLAGLLKPLQDPLEMDACCRSTGQAIILHH